MLIFKVLALLILPGLVISFVLWTALAETKGGGRVKYWARVTGLLSVIFSMPVCLMACVGLFLMLLGPGYGFTPWVKSWWYGLGWLTAFLWVPALIVILLMKGAAFEHRRWHVTYFGVIGVGMSVLSVINLVVMLLAALAIAVFTDIETVYEIKPPNDAGMITIEHERFQEDHYGIYLQNRQSYPILQKRLYEEYFEKPVAFVHVRWSESQRSVRIDIGPEFSLYYDFQSGETSQLNPSVADLSTELEMAKWIKAHGEWGEPVSVVE